MKDKIKKRIEKISNNMLIIQKNCNFDINISLTKDKTINILTQLQNIIFYNNFKVELSQIFFNLSKQISIALRYSPKYSKMEKIKLKKISKKLSLKFLEKLPKICKLIQTDLQAFFDGDPAAFNKTEIILSYPGLFAILTNRIAHELYLLQIPLIPRIMTEYAHAQTGIDIHPGAVLGKYLFIDHGTGVVVGETAIIGDNVKIYQGVTIGALSTKAGRGLCGKKRHPTIMDNVIIYAGASILGGDTVIGKNSIIGGNVFITSSIPDNTKVSIKNQDLQFK